MDLFGSKWLILSDQIFIAVMLSEWFASYRVMSFASCCGIRQWV